MLKLNKIFCGARYIDFDNGDSHICGTNVFLAGLDDKYPSKYFVNGKDITSATPIGSEVECTFDLKGDKLKLVSYK